MKIRYFYLYAVSLFYALVVMRIKETMTIKICQRSKLKNF